MKVLKSIWLTNPVIKDYQWTTDTIVGIIKAANEYGDIYWYIGQAAGQDEQKDIQSILAYGVKYDADQINMLKNLFS